MKITSLIGTPTTTINSLPPELVLRVLHFLPILDHHPLKCAGSRYIANVLNQHAPRLSLAEWCEAVSEEDAWSQSLPPDERRPAMCITIERERESLVRYYMEEYRNFPIKIEGPKTIENRVYYAALHWAAYYGSEKISRLLLDWIHIRRGDRKMTVLHVAAMCGQAGIAKLFLDHGAEVNALDTYGKTALQFALENGHYETAALLWSNGAVAGLDGVLEKYPDTWPKFLRGKWRPNAEFPPLPENEMLPNLTERELAIISFLQYQCAKFRLSDAKVFSLQRHVMHGAIIHNLQAGIISMLDEENFDVNTERLCTQRMYITDENDIRIDPELDNCCADHCCFTALHLAISLHNHELTKFLLDRGADATRECPLCGWGEETPLHCAVRHGNQVAAQLLLDSGLSVDIRPHWGLTPLHVAASKGNLPFLEFLLSKGADINARTAPGNTPLHYAVLISHYYPDNVTFLLDHGANVNAVGSFNQTPLHHAKTLEILEILLARGADPNAKDADQRTRLHIVMLDSGQNFRKKSQQAHPRLEKAFDLLLRYGADLNARDLHGKSLLKFGITWRSSLLSKLLSCGLDPNIKGPRGLPIIRTAMKKDNRFFAALLRYGANVHFTDGSGNTLLHLILTDEWRPKSQERFIELLERGVDVNARNDKGETALQLAAEKGKLNLIPALLEKGANVNSYPMYNKKTPLLYLYEKGWIHPQLTERFIAYGANVHVRDDYQQTLLHYAAMHDHGVHVIPILLSHGAEVNPRDGFGWTPLHGTHKSRFGEIHTKLLLNHGANVNAKVSTGDTALHLASGHDNGRHIIPVLLNHGAKVNSKGAKGKTPLHETRNSSLGHLHAQILLSHGADANAQDVKGRTLLHRTVTGKCAAPLPIIRVLAKHGCDPNIRDAQGLTPLHLAIERQVGIDAVATILSMGADVNAKNENGETVLVYLTRRPGLTSPRWKELLLSYGAREERPIESEMDWIGCFDTPDPRFVAEL